MTSISCPRRHSAGIVLPVRSHKTFLISPVCWGVQFYLCDCVRDTIVAAFTKAYNKEADTHPALPELYKAAYALLKLALIVTSDSLA